MLFFMFVMSSNVIHYQYHQKSQSRNLASSGHKSEYFDFRECNDGCDELDTLDEANFCMGICA